jgi:long-chain acyl-CoA synthetase
MSRLAARWQASLEREGLNPGDRVAVILSNCLEWALFDLAALGLGLVTVPLFASDRPSSILSILKDTSAKLVLVQDWSAWLSLDEADDQLTELKKIVAASPNGDENNLLQRSCSHPGEDCAENCEYEGALIKAGKRPGAAALAEWLAEDGGEYTAGSWKPADLATIVYTSGATGMPKGVMLSHANILENAFACLQRIIVYSEDLFLSFLPLSHTFERTVGYYIPMMAGACVAYVRSIEKLSEDFLEVRPTVLISVPRIYERIHKKIFKELENRTIFSRSLFRLTVYIGWRRFLHLQGRLKWNPLFLSWPVLERAIAKRLTNAFGGRLRLSISGGAPIAFPVARILIALGLNLLQGYGMTETSPVVSVNTPNCNDPVTAGRPLPGIETSIAANGELLVRGPNVMLGYWQNREATGAAIDSRGWLHTGDVAEMDGEGRLKIVGRIKEIIVLSTGEKISPGDLELAIAANPLFEQVMVVGEGRPYMAALVVLSSLEWERLGADKNLTSDRREQLLSDKGVEHILLSEIARMTQHFPEYAQIRRVHASFHPWRIRDGLITSTLKLRRKELLERFKTEVDSLYDGH